MPSGLPRCIRTDMTQHVMKRGSGSTHAWTATTNLWWRRTAGETVVWDGYRVAVGRGEGSSGLAFDTIGRLSA